MSIQPEDKSDGMSVPGLPSISSTLSANIIRPAAYHHHNTSKNKKHPVCRYIIYFKKL